MPSLKLAKALALSFSLGAVLSVASNAAITHQVQRLAVAQAQVVVEAVHPCCGYCWSQSNQGSRRKAGGVGQRWGECIAKASFQNFFIEVNLMIWLILLGLLLLLWTPWLLQNRLKLRPRKRKSAWRKTSIPKGPDHSIDLMLRTYRAKSTAPAPPTLPKPLPEVDDWAQLQEAPSTPPKSDPVEFDEWDRLRQPESSAAPVQTNRQPRRFVSCHFLNITGLRRITG